MKLKVKDKTITHMINLTNAFKNELQLPINQLTINEKKIFTALKSSASPELNYAICETEITSILSEFERPFIRI